MSISRVALTFFLFAQGALAMAPARVAAHIDDAQRVTLAGSHLSLAAADVGPLPAETVLQGVTLVFGRTAAQEADLAALIGAQHDAGSPLYRHWLQPAQFAERFGAADADVAAAGAWLRSHGLTVDAVSRTRISFSGTAAQLRGAFGAELRLHADGGFALSADATVPAALGGLVQGVSNLSSFRPKSHLKPSFTSSQTSSHFLTPKDLATIYDVSPVYTAGFDGTGQTIAVIGQSAISLSDIEHFQAAAGVAVHDPQQILMPGTGTSTAVTGDQAESDLDLEYTSSLAPGATIKFVYTGNSKNFNAFNALQYVIENNLATVISSSYGDCEIDLGSGNYKIINDLLAQAATQGQSVVSASGDSGSVDCSGTSGLTAAQQASLAVDFPASSQYVTGVGGTEFPADSVAKTNTTFWTAAVGTDVIGSAKSYIPEQVWNDNSNNATGLSAGGGGVSIFTDRPAYQAGVTGIPAGTKRLVPDVSFSSSGVNAGYIFCSSDTGQTGVTGSCTNGFRDSSAVNLTIAGGTSFAAPVFAGMVALINQRFAPGGQGIVNTTLYPLAASTPAAFHDVTTGNNSCAAAGCSGAGATSYPAGTGYDEATGLGSIDLNALLTVWALKDFGLAAADATVAIGATAQSAITITPVNGYTGTVNWTVASTPALSQGCFAIPSAAVTGPATATLTIDAGSSCAAAAALETRGTPFAMFGFAVLGLFGLRKRRKWLACALLAGAGFTACGGTSSPAVHDVTGSYKVTVTGTDSGTATINSSATLTLTIH